MNDFVDLTGKTILVTGGSRGIGEGIVRGIAALGANVVLNYTRSEESAFRIADEIGRERCLPVQANPESWEDLERLWARAVEWKGRVDTLVNNAAVRLPIPMSASSKQWDDHWMTCLRVNLMATAHLSRMAIAHFEEKGGGSIVGITARIAVRGDRPEFLHDGASKGAMNSLLRGIARHYAKSNIFTYLICVGVVDTRQATGMTDIYGMKEMLDEIPMGRFGTPDEVANVVAFCCSSRAQYSTGTTIDVTGGSFIH